MKCSAIRTPLHSGCMDLQREEVAMCGNVHFAEEEVAMCLAWIGFHEDSGSNCAKSLLGASFNFSRRLWPFARTRECVDGGKEIEGNILETGRELARIGCCCRW